MPDFCCGPHGDILISKLFKHVKIYSLRSEKVVVPDRSFELEASHFALWTTISSKLRSTTYGKIGETGTFVICG
jgi:hypothetical protein